MGGEHDVHMLYIPLRRVRQPRRGRALSVLKGPAALEWGGEPREAAPGCQFGPRRMEQMACAHDGGYVKTPRLTPATAFAETGCQFLSLFSRELCDD